MLVVGHEAGEQERVERGERALHADRGPLAGVDELERLDEELDLADAAFAVLEIEPRLLLLAAARAHELPLDPPVEVPDVVDHRRRDEAREHERTQRREHLRAEHGVGSRRTPAP